MSTFALLNLFFTVTLSKKLLKIKRFKKKKDILNTLHKCYYTIGIYNRNIK